MSSASQLSIEKTTCKRMLWLDWMKTLAMFFIILGHFFPTGSEYIYIFSVQCFFIISGFLDKKEDSNKTFWRKIWTNLYLPMLLVCSINYIFYKLPLSLLSEHTYSVIDTLKVLLGFVFGLHSSLGGMWFVLVLIILKITYQYLPANKYLYGFLFVLFPLCSVFINNYLLDFQFLGISIFKINNAGFEILLAFPFFFCGIFLKKYRKQINDFSNIEKILCLLSISLSVFMLCGHYNNIVFMYANQYGNNIFLFLLGGFTGTFFIYFVSKILQRFNFKTVQTISKGCILILAFHWNIQHLFKNFLPQSSALQWLYSFIILLAFIPVIQITNKYFPVLLGSRKL